MNPLQRRILDFVADRQLETCAPVSATAIRSKILPPPRAVEDRQRVDAAIAAMVPTLLADAPSHHGPAYSVTLDGWLQSHHCGAASKAADDFLRLYFKKVSSSDAEFSNVTWDDVKSEARVGDELLYLYVLVAFVGGLCSGGSHPTGVMPPTAKPTANFGRPHDLEALLDLADVTALSRYRRPSTVRASNANAGPSRKETDTLPHNDSAPGTMLPPASITILKDLLSAFVKTGERPAENEFFRSHSDAIETIRQLVKDDYIFHHSGRYSVSVRGLGLLPATDTLNLLGWIEKLRIAARKAYESRTKESLVIVPRGSLMNGSGLGDIQFKVALFYAYRPFGYLDGGSEDRETAELVDNIKVDIKILEKRSPRDVLAEIQVSRKKDAGQAAAPAYDVALSFAGEQRDYVECVARELERLRVNVFYDGSKEVDLWGKDLAEYLDEVYRKNARYCVVFISAAYAKKVWPRHELKSAIARAVKERNEYILPVRFDDTDLPGLRPTIAYIDGLAKSSNELAGLIAAKVGVVAATQS